MLFRQMKALWLIFLLSFKPCLGQLQSNYIPIQKDEESAKMILSEVKNRYLTDINNLPKKNQSDYKALFKLRYEELTSDLNSDKFIFNTNFNSLLKRVFEKISINNAQIPSTGIRILLSRSNEPNALCVGEGTIIVNLGLFRYLENESQLAFVLCHELAHYTLNHVNNDIINYVDSVNDKNIRNELKKIEKEQYYKNSKAIVVLKPIIYWGRKYSRLKESTADSLALVFMNKTTYKSQDALRCLTLLDIIDEGEFKQNFDFKQILHTSNLQFRQEWISSSKSSLGEFVKDADTSQSDDSLKTHPACKVRIQLLKSHFSIDEKNILNPSDEFLKINQVACMEAVESEFISQNYEQCLYRIIGLLHQYPDNLYLNTMLIRCFYEIHEMRKTHQIGKLVRFQAETSDTNYKMILHLVENINLKEIAIFAKSYLNDRQSKIGSTEEFYYTNILISKMNDDLVEKQKWTQLYLDNFPNGKFANFLF